MNEYYGTFGTGHSHHGHYQPILANTLGQAEKLMFETYGRKWAAMYTEKEFQQAQNRGIFKKLKPLEAIKQEV